jgi:hypothetical protein
MKNTHRLLIDRLKRIFPNMEMICDGELFNDEKDYAPPYAIEWHEFIKTLNDNGLVIANKKDIKV